MSVVSMIILNYFKYLPNQSPKKTYKRKETVSNSFLVNSVKNLRVQFVYLINVNGGNAESKFRMLNSYVLGKSGKSKILCILN